MRKSNRRIWTILLSLAMVLACMPMSVFADDAEDGWEFSNPSSLWPDKTCELKIQKYDEATGDLVRAKIVDVTTSDSTVVALKSYAITSQSAQTDIVDGVEVTSTSSGTRYKFFLKSKTPGEAVITAKYIVNGESEPRTMTQTVTVEEYPNHIKSLKVNGKSVKISKNKYYYSKENYKKTALKVKIALKKGWKITGLKGVYSDYENMKSFKVTKKMITGKKKISFPKKWKECSIEINMTNGDKTISYKIEMER